MSCIVRCRLCGRRWILAEPPWRLVCDCREYSPTSPGFSKTAPSPLSKLQRYNDPDDFQVFYRPVDPADPNYLRTRTWSRMREVPRATEKGEPYEPPVDPKP